MDIRKYITKKNVIIGAVAGTSIIGGIVALVVRHRKKKEINEFLREEEDFDLDYFGDEFWDDAADHITLNQMFDKYYAQKYNLKETTRSNYKYMYDHFVRDTPDSNVITIRHVVSVYCLMCFVGTIVSFIVFNKFNVAKMSLKNLLFLKNRWNL